MHKVAILLLAAYAINIWAAPCFDDKNLAQLSTQQRPSNQSNQSSQGNQGSLIYVWSPRMVLSAQHAASAQRQAQQLGLAFVPVHDAQVGEAEIQATRSRLAHSPPGPNAVQAQLAASDPLAASAQALAASQSLCAPSLLERDALRHFPTAFVVQPGGQLHPRAIVGAMPEAAWAQSIAQRLQTSKVAAAGHLQDMGEAAALTQPMPANTPLPPSVAQPKPARVAL